jgi:hypothetical protein
MGFLWLGGRGGRGSQRELDRDTRNNCPIPTYIFSSCSFLEEKNGAANISSITGSQEHPSDAAPAPAPVTTLI